MKTMKPCAILRHEKYAIMRFFDHGNYYICGTFDELKHAEDTCKQMNQKTRPFHGTDQYEVVRIAHD